MAEEHGIGKTAIMGFLGVIVIIAVLAFIDLTRDGQIDTDDKTADAIFPFKWSYKMCDEVYIDSLGHRVKVVSQDYSTATCERRDDHHNCTAWIVQKYTNPTIAYMKGWKNADEQELNIQEYKYDSLGRPTRVVVHENARDTSFKFTRDRAIKYDGKGRVIEMLTNNYTEEELLGADNVRYTYYEDKVDSIVLRVSRNRKISEYRVSCKTNYEADPACYYGPNPTFDPHSIMELIYEHMATTDKDLYEKFEFVDSFTEGRLTTKLYCSEKDFSYAIKNALPRSNYPLKEK